MANTALPFFLYPFATVGNVPSSVPPIPNTGTNSDPVNYQNGWTVPYEYPTSNSSYLPVPRTSFNQLFLDITTALQQFQWQGVPLWVSPGAGGPTAYKLYSHVLYSNTIWESQVDTNTSIPGADNNWLPISGNAQGVLPGTIIDFAGFQPPAGYLPCWGQTESRATYPNLFNVLAPQIACNTVLGTTVTITGGAFGSSFGMFVGMAVEGPGIDPFTTIASIPSLGSTTIILNQPATAVQTGALLRFFSWGSGDGSSTFNLPGCQNRVMAGQDNTGAGLLPETPGDNISQPGQKTGVQARVLAKANLPAHTHPTTSTQTVFTGTGYYVQQGGAALGLIVGGGGIVTPFSNSDLPGATANTTVVIGNNTGGGNAFDIIQPTSISNKCIKF